MRYLKENKRLFCIAAILPFFFIYLDKTIILWVKDFCSELKIVVFLQSLDPFINVIGHGATLIFAALILSVAGKFFGQRMHVVGRSLFIGLLSTGTVVQVLKHLIGRARPRLTFSSVFIGPSLKSGYDSFPSGHTALAFCLAYILSQYFPRYRVAFYSFAMVVGFERVEDFAHFPSDILAGAMTGLIVARILSAKIFGSAEAQYARNDMPEIIKG